MSLHQYEIATQDEFIFDAGREGRSYKHPPGETHVIDSSGTLEKAFIAKNPAFTDVTNIILDSTYTEIFGPSYGTLRPVLGIPDVRSIDASGLSKFDLNRDGRPDEYAIKDIKTSHTKDIAISKVVATKLIPTTESAKVLVGQGEASTTWVLRKEEAHATAEEFNWNASVSASLEASAQPFGIGVKTTFTAMGGVGGSTTETNTFTVVNEVRQAYTVPADAYEKGTQVSYGFHLLTGTIELTEQVVFTFEITNAAQGHSDLLIIAGDTKASVYNHVLDLVLTDYDVASPPDLSGYNVDFLMA